MNFLSIDRTADFTVRLMGHHLFTYIDNLVMRFETARYENIPEPGIASHVEKITAANVNDGKGTAITMGGEEELMKQPGNPEGFFLYMEGHENPIARMWVMYRGGTNSCYHIRHIDAWIFNVRVLDKYRGKGCCGFMLKKVMEYLYIEKHIDSVYLAVARNNFPAHRAYVKSGGCTTGEKRSVKLWRFMIPYHNL